MKIWNTGIALTKHLTNIRSYVSNQRTNRKLLNDIVALFAVKVVAMLSKMFARIFGLIVVIMVALLSLHMALPNLMKIMTIGHKETDPLSGLDNSSNGLKLSSVYLRRKKKKIRISTGINGSRLFPIMSKSARSCSIAMGKCRRRS